MIQSHRKLAGAFLLPLSIALWVVLATIIYLEWLMDTPWWVHLPYFCLAGMGWLWPAMAVTGWMSRPDRPPAPPSDPAS